MNHKEIELFELDLFFILSSIKITSIEILQISLVEKRE